MNYLTLFNRLNSISEKKKFYAGAFIVFLIGFVWLYFFLSGLDFNPAYGDDYRSIYIATEEHSLKELTSFLLNPFPVDYYSRGWAEVRPVYYFFLRSTYNLFGFNSYWYYLLKIFSAAILLTLVYIFFYTGTKNVSFSIFVSLFIMSLPTFYFTMRWIADQTHLALIFLLASLIILLKFTENPSYKNLIFFIILSYLSIKSRTDGRLLLPITLLFFASKFEFLKRNIFKSSILVAFLLLTTIPLNTPFSMPANTPNPALGGHSILENVLEFVIQKNDIAEPYGQESFFLFSLPFPLGYDRTIPDSYLPPFSFFPSFGFLFTWLLIFCFTCIIYRLINKVNLSTVNSSFFRIIFVWGIISSIMLGIVATKFTSVELPKYFFSGALPASLLLFYVFYKFYKSIKNEKCSTVFYCVLLIFLIQHLASGFFYQSSMRSIDDSQWYTFDTAVHAIINEEGIKSPEYAFFETGKYEVISRIILEHYNYVIHPIMGLSNLKELLNNGRPFYFVNYAYFNSTFDDGRYLPPNLNITMIKEIKLSADKDLFARFKLIVHRSFTKNNSSEWFAKVYKIQNNGSIYITNNDSIYSI